MPNTSAANPARVLRRRDRIFIEPAPVVADTVRRPARRVEPLALCDRQRSDRCSRGSRRRLRRCRDARSLKQEHGPRKPQEETRGGLSGAPVKKRGCSWVSAETGIVLAVGCRSGSSDAGAWAPRTPQAPEEAQSMPPRLEEWLPMPSSPPHGDDSTLCAATCVESTGCAISVDMTKPEADKAGIAIDEQGSMTPLAIPWIGSANRSNQERVARTRRSIAQYRSVTKSTLLPDEATAAIRPGLGNLRVFATRRRSIRRCHQ